MLHRLKGKGLGPGACWKYLGHNELEKYAPRGAIGTGIAQFTASRFGLVLLGAGIGPVDPREGSSPSPAR